MKALTISSQSSSPWVTPTVSICSKNTHPSLSLPVSPYL